MPELTVNDVGDMVLTEAASMEASHPVRLAIIDRLTRGGTVATAELGRRSNTMLLKYERVPRQWVEDVEPRLDLAWPRAAGVFNAGVAVTADELCKIQADLEKLLEPYVGRTSAPEGSRRVRMLAYFVSSAADG